jgi:predicted  nucleic acid-binding Zn-ribbon protein
METEAQLKRVHVKLQQLLKDYSVLQKENSQLKADLYDARKHVNGQLENIDNLKQQVDVLKYTHGELDGTDKKEFEKKINSYLREIDRCIALLSQ